MKLLAKYNRINILLVVIVFLLSSSVLYFLVNKTLVSELDEVLIEIKGRAENYTHQYQKIPVNSALDDYYIHYIQINQPFTGDSFRTVRKDIPGRKLNHNFRQLTFSTLISGITYQVVIEKPIEGTKDMAKNIINLTVVTIFLVIFILMLINRVVLRRLWRPFYKTLAVVSNFEINKKNNFNFPETTIDEFRYMNDILKRTTQKAGEDYLALKEFTENASHELQTPLAIISSKLDLLIQDEHLTERQEKKIMSAYAALKKMSHLNQSLLLSAKIGNQQFTTTTTISLKEKMAEKLSQFQELWQDQLAVKSNIHESFVRMNDDLNEALINNLLSNATKHNVKGGFIIIDLEPGRLTLSNSGINQPLDPKRLFKRFYKSDLNSNSNGLGLSIIKQICDTSGIAIDYFFKGSMHQFILKWENKDNFLETLKYN